MQHKPVFGARTPLLTALLALNVLSNVNGQDSLEFFESRIRPVLVESCYECHNSHERAEADLALDWRGGMLAKTENGAVLVPFAPDKSLLLQVLRHEIDGLEMPEGRERLPANVIQDFETWIRMGADDPRLQPPSENDLKAQISWEAKFAKRKQRWCFQPIRDPSPPPTTDWARQPVDRFVLEKMNLNGLSPALPAKRRELVRRLSYALTGLPPDEKTIDQFLNDPDPDAFEKLVDHYLDSPHFGERWGRHWMDWVRYADSHGSEGDPPIPFAYRYRDYLIRAINDDVAYNQLVREHLAGDLLETPRVNQDLGLNESAIGTAHLRFVFHGFAPTDALDEKVRFTDDQINVFGKAFLGLTISCARCHDHKFDAVSQRDYYALFGVFGSCRPAMQDVNTRERQLANRRELAKLKDQIRKQVANTWLADLENGNPMFGPPGVAKQTDDQPRSGTTRIWAKLASQVRAGVPFNKAWGEIEKELEHQLTPNQNSKNVFLHSWDIGQPSDFEQWFPKGNGIGNLPNPAGEFMVSSDAEKTIDAILPSGVYTNSVSKLHRGVLDSPRFLAEPGTEVFLQLMGGGQASVRYVVQNYPRDGTVFPIHRINRKDWYWHRLDLNYWAGDQVHLELATAQDTPLKIASGDRSWFGVRRVIVQKKGQPAPVLDFFEDARLLWLALQAAQPDSLEVVASCYRDAISKAVQAWRSGNVSDEQALFLNACLKSGWLANSFAQDSKLQACLAEYRRIESQIPIPTRVPGVSEANASDQPLFHRGDHRQPRDSVPRGFLTVLNSKPFDTPQSGRLELAEMMVADTNPLTTRVMVNRIWLHLFGRGIVDTPDNFGELGAMPTHPELLDYLATRFREENWSIKKTIRRIVLSKTWQQDSRPSADALGRDPQNQWMSHANVRRLDAESIRDTLLAVSGELDRQMFGPTVSPNSNSRRRSIYVRANRNSMDHLLTTFDAPVPFSTVGKRNVTNVPDQALAMMNGDFVVNRAARLGANIGEKSGRTEDQRLNSLIRTVLRRPATESEIDTLKSYLAGVRKREISRTESLNTLKKRREQVAQQIEAILHPAEAKLLQAKATGETSDSSGPQPVARWEFDQGPEDLAGNLNVNLVGSARFTADGLRLDGNGFARTAPLDFKVSEKTLEVLLRLDSLRQRGGGVMSIQDLSGNQFDSIVFAEQTPRRWMAGSEFFKRTKPISQASDETSDSVLHLAMVYEADGTIRAYRNGRPYGQPYRSGTPLNFAPDESQLLFGMRHGTQVSSGRMLTGWLLAARLYDRALSPVEISTSFSGQPYVSRKEVLASLTAEEREKVGALQELDQSLRQQETELAVDGPSLSPYARAAHLLLNLKELIYVR